MLRQIGTTFVVGVVLLAGCTPTGELKNPFEPEKAFVPSPVPGDFAIVVDESHNTTYVRQKIQQVIAQIDTMSRTTYTNYSDLNDTVSSHYSQETPLSPSQMQAMWNAVSQNNLMEGSVVSINFLTGSDWYKKNIYTLQIRANGHTRIYQQTNGFPGPVRPLITLVDAVRLPMSQDSKVPVVGGEAPAPATQNAPATAPAAQ